MTDIFKFGSIQIRTAGTPTEPLFCIGDVCDALEISDASDAAERLDPDDVEQITAENSSRRVSYRGPTANMYVREPGLYDLIQRSNKQEAKAFKRWVNHEVLPSIRKTGSYLAKPMDELDVLAASIAQMQQIKRAQAEHERRLASVEATQAKAAAEVSEALALPPAPVDASERTQGQMAVALLKAWGLEHSSFDVAHRMLYQAVLERPETRLDLRARLDFVKRNKERGKQAKRLCDIIDESGKSELVYAIARQLFVRSEAVGS